MIPITTPFPLRPRLLLAPLAIIAVFLGIFVAAPTAEAASTVTKSTSSVIKREASGWSYYRATTAPASTWKTDTTGTGWRTGTAPFGVGTTGLTAGTTLPTISGTQPLASYYRKTFTLTKDLPEYAWLNTWADDGIVVWVNGTEVGRKNAPTGAITDKSYATAAPSTKKARSEPVTFTVPAKLLKEGANTIAVQVLANYRKTPNVSFDAHFVREDHTSTATTPPVAPTTPPTTPTTPTTPPTTPTTPPTTPTTPPTTPDAGDKVEGWGTPTWRDEFDYVDPATGAPAVDPTKWNVRGRDDLGLLFDAAVPDRGQVTVDGADVLHIRGDWLDQPVVRPSNQTGPRELWHKTGYLDQRKLQSDDVSMAQQYGRWEIRAKTPSGPNTFGSLAAFWLRNSQSGEIDIMEAWGYDDAAVRDQRIDTATTTIHTHTADPAANQRYIWHHQDFGGPTPVWDDFHTYAFEFTPSYAAVIVDGKEMLRATPASHPNLWKQEFFGSPLHMRLNLHIGPSEKYWGLPDPNNKAATQNLDFQVDYVRTWAYTGS